MSTFSALKPRSQAEVKLLACARKGKWCELGEERPDQAGQNNTIRAELVRALLLQIGNHESGVQITGGYIEGSINLDGVSKLRPLHMVKTTINGDLSFADAETGTIHLDCCYVKAIRGYGAKVNGDLLVWTSTVDSGAHLFGIKVTGSLSFANSTIRKYEDGNKDKKFSILLETAFIGGKLYLKGINTEFNVIMDDATITGSLDCENGHFGSFPEEDPKTNTVRALSAYRARIGGNVVFRSATSTGELTFTGADIGGDVDCGGGRFKHNSEIAPVSLRFSRSQIGGNVYLNRGFESVGKVEFNGTKISGAMNCVGGAFRVIPGIKGTDLGSDEQNVAMDALSLVNADIRAALKLTRAGEPEDDEHATPAFFAGSLDLKGTSVRLLVDSKQSWPQITKDKELPNVIHMDGFTYERLGGDAPRDAKTRMEWLNRQPKRHMGKDFRPQPFEQLIKVLKNMGHPEDVRVLAIKREKRLHRSRWAKWWRLIPALSAIFSAVTAGWLMGYGYRPLRVLWFMIPIAILCGFFYDYGREQGAFAPRDSQVLLQYEVRTCVHPQQVGKQPGTWHECLEKHVKEYPRFDPYIYSFNVLLPVIDLFQEKSWVPVRQEVTLTLPYIGSIKTYEQATEFVVYAELAFGAIVSILAVALFSGLIRKVRTD
ncbi:hypothetical protein KKP04_11725 [Rhodomicrobium sp. Az07]|uniref:hypothetical protein n=1 Tax=Rhodomicrobium sp. Az07 TaxID=2839034 RepID=UPI001BE8417E|nr:hypothetical protein [Rhodomicrobium sp. Az07]MBT3071534.1 hypothetical protein [Rhodomicrobium sp. Az07]